MKNQKIKYEKKVISIFEIFIMVLGIFSFSFILGVNNLELVSAVEN